MPGLLLVNQLNSNVELTVSHVTKSLLIQPLLHHFILVTQQNW